MSPSRSIRFPWKRLIVGVTAEGHCVPAVERAYRLAVATDAKVRLVHSLELPSLWGGVQPPDRARRHPEYLTAARSRVLDVLGRALGDRVVPTARFGDDLRVVPGPPGKVLHAECADFDADLLLIGPHRRRGLLDIGGTARAVLATADIPLWIEPPPDVGESSQTVASILVPIDFSPSTPPAVDVAVRLARQLGASLRFLHCYAPPAFAYTDASSDPGPLVPTYVVDQEREDAKKELADFIAHGSWDDLDVGSSFHEGDPVEGITEHAKEHDLVIVGTHGRTGLSRFLLGSVAYGTLRRCGRPVVVVPSDRTVWLLEEGWSPA